MGWLVDPVDECVIGFTPSSCLEIYESHDAQLPVPEFATDFQLTIGELVAWLYE